MALWVKHCVLILTTLNAVCPWYMYMYMYRLKATELEIGKGGRRFLTSTLSCACFYLSDTQIMQTS